MIAETISLGILSLPSVLARIGLVPGLILLVGLGIIATYTGWVSSDLVERCEVAVKLTWNPHRSSDSSG